jgi:hypothetical protein
MMDGRVKTLHPKVHGGLLAVRDNAEHVASMNEHAIGAIDLVVVNLYPFVQTVAKGGTREEIIENIDIGGPSMVRSAAKNHEFVAIVTDPADYAAVASGETTLAQRRKFAAKAYALTASYDGAISQWFAHADQGEAFPRRSPSPPSAPPNCAMARIRTRRRRSICQGPGGQGHRQCRAGAGQGAELQQLQRRRCRAGAGRRIPRCRADRRDRQACQPLRRRHRRHAGRGL